MNKPIRARMIIFTESCPLDCRYCDPKNESNYGTDINMTEEQLNSLVDLYDKEDDQNFITTKLTFSGGEPFLYWEWIKKIILKYKNRFMYEFNTSGYLLTEEIIEFLSHYYVNFVLSVDGNEKLTNYLRPVKATPYHTGYYKQLKQILPTLLYYFPYTPYKFILNARYVDLLYEIYQDADRLGFKYFTYIIDFGHRKINNKDYQKWEEKHTQILQQQLELIVEDQIFSFINNVKKPELTIFNELLTFFNKNIKEYDPEYLKCKLFNQRSLISFHDAHKEQIKNCLSFDFPDLNVLYHKLLEEYNSLEQKCPKDNQCPAFLYCSLNCCPQRSFIEHNTFFDFDILECYINKTAYNALIKFLLLGQEFCKDNFLYNSYILDYTFSINNKKEG